MKKVRKSEIEQLIAQYYCDYIEVHPVNEYLHETLNINVGSIYIFVKENMPVKDKQKKDTKMCNFARAIEEVSFGNLKVVRRSCEKIGENGWMSYMYIANGYEVIE